MCDQQHNLLAHSDDEEDLESLRLAALKSLNTKKDGLSENINCYTQSKHSTLTLIEPNQSTSHHYVNSINTAHQSATNHGLHPPHSAYETNDHKNISNSPNHYFPTINRSLQLPHHTFNNNYENRLRLANIELNEPYIPQPQLHRPPVIPNNNVSIAPRPIQKWPPIDQMMGNNLIYNSSNTATATSYTPKPIVSSTNSGTHAKDVQLSPRSLAFVAQNNNILLARRKNVIDKSPISGGDSRRRSPEYSGRHGFSRSPSPPYRQSPGRWSSISPPPNLSRQQRFSKSKSKSPRPSRSRFMHKRSISRSPARSESPRSNIVYNRRRSISRSPNKRRLSPAYYNRYSSRSPPSGQPPIKRIKSRSPIPRRFSPITNTSVRRLSRSRSPPSNFPNRNRRSPQIMKRRTPPLNNNNNNNKNTRYPRKQQKSPIRGNRKSPVNRDNNYRRDSPSNNFNRRNIQSTMRKSLSPSQQTRIRTPPKSPIHQVAKKYIRRSRDRPIRNQDVLNIRKRSPINNKNRNKNDNFRNKNDLKQRSVSPFNVQKRQVPKRKDDYRKPYDNRMDLMKKQKSENEEMKRNPKVSIDLNTNENIKITQNENSKRVEVPKIDSNFDKIEAKTPPVENFESLTPPINMDIDEDQKLIEKIDAMLAGEDKRKNNHSNENDSSDNDKDDDGIDLFASEESESENEGRFKSGSNRNERKENTSALSLAKLSESSVPLNVKNLQEVVSDEKINDRFNKNRRRDNYFKKLNNRNGKSERRNEYFPSRRRSRSNSNDKNDVADSTKAKFKSTFQTIRNEGMKTNSKTISKDISSATQGKIFIKKRLKDRTDSLETNNRKFEKSSTPPPPYLIEQLNKPGTRKHSISPAIAKLDQMEKQITDDKTTNGKKPIHSRLGAMTNTFKAAKKLSSWTSSSPYDDQV